MIIRAVRLATFCLFAAFFISTELASQGYAQTNDKAIHDRLWLENIEKFEEWRRNIPDFEKRLYDRVKAVNKRVIRVQNLVIASFFLLLVFYFVFFTLIYKRLDKNSGAVSPSDSGNTANDASLHLTGTAPDTFNLLIFSRNLFFRSLLKTQHFFLDTVPLVLKPVASRIGEYLPKVVSAPDAATSSETNFPPINSFRSFQDAVLRGISGKEIPLGQEIRFFTTWFVPFVLLAFVLLVINPYQSLHAMDIFQAFMQTMNQIPNGNSAFGVSANWLIYGSGDFAVNAQLLPAFKIGSWFSDKYLPTVSFTVFAVELFISIYISCRLFRLPLHIAMMTAWLAPLVYIPFVYPFVVLLEHYLVTPFMFSMSGFAILFIALFYRLGKSTLGNTIAVCCCLFLISSYVTMAYLYYFIVYAYNIIWACIPIFIFASSMKERAVKIASGIILGMAFYLLFYDYISIFYNFNMGDTVQGYERSGGILFSKIWKVLVNMFSSIDAFLTTLDPRGLPLFRHANNIFFTALFLYLTLISVLFYIVLAVNKTSSTFFQISIIILFMMFGMLIWPFGYHETIIAPLYVMAFILGVVGIVQILPYFLRQWLPALKMPRRILENNYLLVSKHSDVQLFLPERILLNIRSFMLVGLIASFAIFYVFKVYHSPDSKMGYVYGAKPDLEAYQILEHEIGISTSPTFRGRLASTAFIEDAKPYYSDMRDPSGKTLIRDFFVMERDATWRIAGIYGGDFTFSPRKDRIPILHDNNRFTGPGLAVIERYLLSEPEDRLIVQNHNISIFNRRILEFLGVRFVLTSERIKDDLGAVLRRTEMINHLLTLYLYELPDANTGAYSPTEQKVFTNATEALDLISDPALDFKKTFLVEKTSPGHLVPALSSEAVINGDILSVEARSEGKSLVVLPFEYSHCLTLENKPGASGTLPKLLSVNLHQIGLIFEHSASVNIEFRLTPFNPNCREQDRLDWVNLSGRDLKYYKGVFFNGGYEKY